MSKQVEDIFFQIGRGTTDSVNLIVANHLGQRNADLRGAHGPCHGDHHLPALIDKRFVSLRGGQGLASIEVQVVLLHEFADRHCFILF